MTATETINFTRGVPAIESFPTADLSACAVTALAGNSDVMLQYGPAAGLAGLRAWLAEWQGVKPEEVITGNGSLELVEFLCTAMIRPGDVVFTESPSYDRAITLFRRHGANVIGVPLQHDGPDLAALEQLLAQHKPKLFYVIPDFQNPSGATCSTPKRKALVEIARKHDLLLLEDAPYRLLRYRGTQEPTLFSLAPERTLHMTSFTKLIAPGVRLGLMIGDAAMLAKIGKVAEDTYITPGYFAHGVTHEWLKADRLGPQIEKLKALYAPRLDACLAAIDKYIPDAVATRAATKDDAPKDEAYWRGRVTALRDAKARAESFAEALQSRINALSNDFVNRDDPAQRNLIAADRQKAIDELARVQKEIQEHAQAMDDLQTEARRAGAPAGWLR
jgi:DNA-binding transcriptional MocR family regulator